MSSGFFKKSCTFLICPTDEGVSRARRGRERQRRWRCTDKGAILSRERMAPLDPPRERKGLCPLTPHIAGLQLEGLHALRSVGAVYMASP